jgi:hypothetical protein
VPALPQGTENTSNQVEQRFWSKVNKDTESGCWEWTDSLDSGGYGRIRVAHKLVPAHIFIWKMVHPDYPPIQYVRTVDHECRNRKCVNIHHLRMLTHVENIMIGECPPAQNARKTHCKNGHEFTPKNTKWEDYSRRRCKTCEREYNRNRPNRSRNAK